MNLLPCPFCGSPAVRTQKNHWHFVKCSMTGCVGWLGASGETPDEVVEKWNRRAPQQGTAPATDNGVPDSVRQTIDLVDALKLAKDMAPPAWVFALRNELDAVCASSLPAATATPGGVAEQIAEAMLPSDSFGPNAVIRHPTNPNRAITISMNKDARTVLREFIVAGISASLAARPPDRSGEAVQIIRDLLEPSYEYGYRFNPGAREKAVDFLATIDKGTVARPAQAGGGEK
jgi:hypothetical protein